MVGNLRALSGAAGVRRAARAAGICLLGGMAALAHAQNVNPTTTLSVQAQAGQKLFFDTNLSGSKQMSCATCHDPNNHYAQPATNTLAVQLGGPNLTSPGLRAVPTLTYKQYIPPYSDNAPNPDGVSSNSPGGGFTWDGRADTQAQQAAIPLLSSFEMANTSQAAVVAVVQNASYAALFQQAYGADVFSNTQAAFTDIGLALQAYQQQDPSFNAFTSKYDYATAPISFSTTRAIASPATTTARLTAVAEPCSPTLRTRTRACPATPRSQPMRRRSGCRHTTTWGCARR